MHFAGSLDGLVTCRRIIDLKTPFHDTHKLWVDFGNCVQMVLKGGIQWEEWTICSENNPVNHWVYLVTIDIVYPQKS